MMKQAQAVKWTGKDAFNYAMPITKTEKLDDGRLMIEGVATSEAVDADGELMDYETAKSAFSTWRGNIREQHDPKKAVGRAIEYSADDIAKTITLRAFISKGAQDTQEKILDGTLSCFSIAGKAEKKVPEIVKTDKGDIKVGRIYVKAVSETSVVDSGSNPDSPFTIVKAEGEQLLASGVDEPAEPAPAPEPVVDVQASAEDKEATEEIAKMLNDGSVKASELLDLVKAAKEKPATKESKPAAKEAKPAPKKDDKGGDDDGEAANAAAMDASNTANEASDGADSPADHTAAAGAHTAAAAAHKAAGSHAPAQFHESMAAYHQSESTSTKKAVETADFRKSMRTIWDRIASELPVPAPISKTVKPDFTKGMYAIQCLASILDNIQYLMMSAEYEAQNEGDDSPQASEIRAWLKTGGELLVRVAQEEVGEMTPEDEEKMVKALGASAHHFYNFGKRKGTDSATFAKAIADKDPAKIVKAIRELDVKPTYTARVMFAKAGARHSKADMERLQSIHDHSVGMGAECSTEKAVSGGDIQKIEGIDAAIEKATKPLNDTIAKLTEDVAFMKAQPAFKPNMQVRVIEKTADSANLEEKIANDLKITPVMNRDGSIDMQKTQEAAAMELTKLVHKYGRREA